MFPEEEQYFKESLDFFYENQWLFRYPVTELLVRNLLDSFPDCWLDTLTKLTHDELNNFVTGKLIKDHWPKTLISFALRCKKFGQLSTRVDDLTDFCQLPKNFTKGLSQKKQQEISCFTQVIHKMCLEQGITAIVDLGAGLGYVCQLLHYLHGYRVLGFESNLNNVKTARERQTLLYSNSLKGVVYICTTINENSTSLIEENMIKYFNSNEKICIIGLHSCGELTINAFKLFSTIQSASLLIILSCCYHKLSLNNENHINNFPLSKTMKKIVEENLSVKEILNRTFLRLASQEPISRWAKMSFTAQQQQAFCVVARAVFECVANKSGLLIKKCVRKATRKSQCKNFDTYLVDSLKRYTFNGENCSGDSKLIRKLEKAWEQHNEKIDIAKFYTGLQLMLQNPAESLVLYDRRCWLREHGLSARIFPVLCNEISPRCYATIAKKHFY